VIYAAQSASLAALEIMVHYSVLPQQFALTEIKVPHHLVPMISYNAAELPAGWDGDVPIHATQSLGESWVRAGVHTILRVPSSIVPTEHNFVINPEHTLFSTLQFMPPVPFRFDPRLK
jgi:RES domain-containing protein